MAAKKSIEYDNESMRIAKLQLGCNAEIRSLLKRAQEVKTELLQTYLIGQTPTHLSACARRKNQTRADGYDRRRDLSSNLTKRFLPISDPKVNLRRSQ
jgi:hypothetical protein